MFYQASHSLTPDSVKIETGQNFSFPLHLHENFELITVTSGTMTVTVDGADCELRPGTAVLIFPDQVHSLRSEGECRHVLWIFSTSLVRAFSPVFSERVPEKNLFVLPPALSEQLFSLREGDGILRVKGVLYSVCAEFDARASYRERGGQRDALLFSVFGFVKKNYGEDCSLKRLAAELSYHSVYLSRYFTERTGTSFTGYVAKYRVSEACTQLLNTDHGILRVAMDCGFRSVRSFNRNFRAQTGQTPGEYRRAFAGARGGERPDAPEE